MLCTWGSSTGVLPALTVAEGDICFRFYALSPTTETFHVTTDFHPTLGHGSWDSRTTSPSPMAFAHTPSSLQIPHPANARSSSRVLLNCNRAFPIARRNLAPRLPIPADFSRVVTLLPLQTEPRYLHAIRATGYFAPVKPLVQISPARYSRKSRRPPDAPHFPLRIHICSRG